MEALRAIVGLVLCVSFVVVVIMALSVAIRGYPEGVYILFGWPH